MQERYWKRLIRGKITFDIAGLDEAVYSGSEE